MDRQIDKIYDQALKMLQNGHSVKEVLLEFKDHKNELEVMLAVSSELLNLPKKTVPTPLMQRKFATAAVKNFWLTWFNAPRLAVSVMSFALIFSALAAITYKSFHSSPGEPLFAVKKTGEKLQLVLASNSDAKAKLQIELAKKRLAEAQEIFSDPNSGPEQQKAALSELADQTSTAVAEVKTVAQNDPDPEKNHPLLNSLDNITEQQENLLAAVLPDSKVKEEASLALDTLSKNNVKISEIKQTVAAAAEKEKTLATLKADPDAVSALGEILKISEKTVTVDEKDFTVSEKTTIKDQSGKILTLKDLSKKVKINILGKKADDTLIAEQIFVISTSPGKVEGTSTVIAAPKAATASTGLSSVKKLPETKNVNSSSTVVSEPINPNTAIGTFILEDPSPQYVK